MTQFEEFVQVIRRLRSPGGCPWDREQTHESLKPPCIEEAAELIGATEGLGWYVKNFSDFADYARVVVGIIFIVCIRKLFEGRNEEAAMLKKARRAVR